MGSYGQAYAGFSIFLSSLANRGYSLLDSSLSNVRANLVFLPSFLSFFLFLPFSSGAACLGEEAMEAFHLIFLCENFRWQAKSVEFGREDI